MNDTKGTSAEAPTAVGDVTYLSSPEGVFFAPGHYLPVPALALRRALCEDGVLGPQPDWGRFCYLLRLCFAQEMWSETERLKAAWALIHAAPEHWWHDHNRRQDAEQHFLDAFLRVLKRANFRPVAYQQIQEAERDDFLYMLPLRVDWERLDGRFLTRFYESHPQWREMLPEGPQHERMLIFFRGIGEEQETGRFLLQKIDLLLGDLLLLVPRALRTLWRWWKGERDAPEQADVAVASRWTSYSSMHGLVRRRRVTLRTAGYGLRNLFRKTTIVEPTFQEVVLLYRMRRTPGSRQRGAQHEPLQIRAYRDIPLSDLEVIFPAKRVSMKPLDLIKLTVTALIGVVAVGMKILTSLLNPVVLLMTLASLAGYGSKIVFQFKVSKDRYMLLLTDALYSKHRDNDLGVILYLVDSVVEQEYKESLLAYAFLARGGPMTEEALDRQCEQFLLDHFGLRVDFESSDALAKLQRLGLAETDGTTWRAVPLEDAVSLLVRLAWERTDQDAASR